MVACGAPYASSIDARSASIHASARVPYADHSSAARGFDRDPAVDGGAHDRRHRAHGALGERRRVECAEAAGQRLGDGIDAGFARRRRAMAEDVARGREGSPPDRDRAAGAHDARELGERARLVDPIEGIAAHGGVERRTRERKLLRDTPDHVGGGKPSPRACEHRGGRVDARHARAGTRQRLAAQAGADPDVEDACARADAGRAQRLQQLRRRRRPDGVITGGEVDVRVGEGGHPANVIGDGRS